MLLYKTHGRFINILMLHRREKSKDSAALPSSSRLEAHLRCRQPILTRLPPIASLTSGTPLIYLSKLLHLTGLLHLEIESSWQLAFRRNLRAEIFARIDRQGWWLKKTLSQQNAVTFFLQTHSFGSFFVVSTFLLVLYSCFRPQVERSALGAKHWTPTQISRKH